MILNRLFWNWGSFQNNFTKGGVTVFFSYEKLLVASTRQISDAQRSGDTRLNDSARDELQYSVEDLTRMFPYSKG